MKQIQIINAYKTMDSLADNTNFSKQDQWNLYKLRKQLFPRVEFQQDQEDMIREKYLPFTNEEGMLPAPQAQEYLKEMNELNNLEVDQEFEKAKVALVDGINFKTIEALEDFIEFEP